MDHIAYMKVALEEAQKAFDVDEVPIGAVIIYKDSIIARAHNLRETHKSPTAHAEILVMEMAAKYLNSWNLSECTLYVNVEPCPMCAGALIQSQINTIVFALNEPNSGSFGSVINLAQENFNHKPKIISGIMVEESKELMQSFFRNRRKKMVKVKSLSQDQLKAYFDIRIEVFVDEQNVDIELEYDEYDKPDLDTVVHVGAFIDDQIVGAMRLIKKGTTLKLGRLAVKKENRKDGVGSALLKYALKQAENNGYERIDLSAQVNAIPFYEKNGYTVYGEIEMDAGIEHKSMDLMVKKR